MVPDLPTLYTTPSYLTTPASWVVAPSSLPCSPPPSCLDPFLLSQASPLHRDRPPSHDDGGMHNRGRSCLFRLTRLGGCRVFQNVVVDHLVQMLSPNIKLQLLQQIKKLSLYQQQLAEPPWVSKDTLPLELKRGKLVLWKITTRFDNQFDTQSA